jgi:hypothetical protein
VLVLIQDCVLMFFNLHAHEFSPRAIFHSSCSSGRFPVNRHMTAHSHTKHIAQLSPSNK